jgi:LysM repeat protein
MTYNPEPVITQVSSEVMIETGGQNISQYEYNEGGYAVSITQEEALTPEITQAVTIAPEAIIETREVAIAAPATAIAAPATGITYIVQEGDTAWSLSRKSCSSPADIRALNSLEGDFLIKAGEVISLPANSCK